MHHELIVLGFCKLPRDPRISCSDKRDLRGESRRGFDVLGLDAATDTIAAADAHAAGQGLRMVYRVGAPEDLARRQPAPHRIQDGREMHRHGQSQHRGAQPLGEEQ